jgi:hypothetical protein
MKLSFAEQVIVETHKLELYLLSATHPDGRHKSRVFIAAGFDSTCAESLRRALASLARESEMVEEADSPFGRKFVVKGEIASPAGKPMRVCSVWMLRQNQPPPYFVTAYPWKP